MNSKQPNKKWQAGKQFKVNAPFDGRRFCKECRHPIYGQANLKDGN